MTTADEERLDTSWRPGVPEVALLAGITVGVAVLYLVGQVWPAWHNGFLTQPHDEWSTGQQDPKDVWPSGTSVGPLMSTAGVLSAVLLMPLVPPVGGLGAAIVAVTAARQGRRRLASVAWAVFGLCVALAAVHFSPLGLALNSWTLD